MSHIATALFIRASPRLTFIEADGVVYVHRSVRIRPDRRTDHNIEEATIEYSLQTVLPAGA